MKRWLMIVLLSLSLAWVLAQANVPFVELKGHTYYVYSVVFSPDGRTLASGSADNTIRLWDVSTGKPKGQPLEGHAKAVLGVAFSPDGRTLASGSADNTIRLWDVSSGKQKGQPLKGHTDSVIDVAFSPDGRTLASGSADNTIRLWDVSSGKPKGQPLKGHTSFVYSVAFSPDGQTLASGGVDFTIRLWDVSSGKQKGQPLKGHTNTVLSVAFSPDGRTLASGSMDNTIRLWDVSSITNPKLDRVPPNPSPSKNSRLWVLSVGVNKYQYLPAGDQLSLAVNDAQSIAKVFTNIKPGAFKDRPNVKLLTDTNATVGTVRDAMKTIRTQAGPNDTVIVFFSAHGVISENDGRYYLLLNDSRMKNLPGTAIGQQDLSDFYSSLPAKTLIILDTCHAAAATKGPSSLPSKDVTVAAESLNAANNTTAPKTILAGTNRDEQASEDSTKLKNGAFTMALLEVLEGKAAGYEGPLSLSSLVGYVVQRVPRIVTELKLRTMQTPQSWYQGSSVPNFLIRP
jgi:hypothetical protein